MSVFISYRRGDSAGHAGRLRDALEAALGPDQVFQDVTSLAPGEHFADAIRGSIESADVVLVVIGRHWADAADAGGGRRLDDPADVVRLEVETALASGRRTVPVLVDGATLPSAAALPPSMAPLLAAARGRAARRVLVERCRAAGAHERPRAHGTAHASPSRWRWAVVGLVAIALAVIAAVVFWPQDPDPGGDGQAGDGTDRRPSPPPPRPAPRHDHRRRRRGHDTSGAGTCPSEPSGERQPAPADASATGRVTEFTVADWYREPAGDGHQRINVDLTVTALSAGGLSLEPGNFNAKVDGFQQPEGSFCYHVLRGSDILGPQDQVQLLLTGTLDEGDPVEINLGGYGSNDTPIVVLS